jgi:hypothetical protein
MTAVVDRICAECGYLYRGDSGKRLTGGPLAEDALTIAETAYDPADGFCLNCWCCPGWNGDDRPTVDQN